MARASGCCGVNTVAPLCLATGGSGIARTTLEAGTLTHHSRSASICAVETRLITVCVGLNLSERTVSSAMAGSTPMKTTSDWSTTCWLLFATRTRCGNSSKRALAFLAFLGDTVTTLGGAGKVHKPRTSAADIVPQPTKPILLFCKSDRTILTKL
eukprot:4991046-Pleurochrysis_carterae.AAC.1